jgi:hypothetical protein
MSSVIFFTYVSHVLFFINHSITLVPYAGAGGHGVPSLGSRMVLFFY